MRQILFFLFVLWLNYATAQDSSRMETDRPDQTDGANVLNKKEVQFETELYYNTFDSGRAAIISSSLLRYGLFKNCEVRLLIEEGRERDKFIDETTQGFYPLALSVKLALLKDHPILPDVVLITYVKMPLSFVSLLSSDLLTIVQSIVGGVLSSVSGFVLQPAKASICIINADVITYFTMLIFILFLFLLTL